MQEQDGFGMIPSKGRRCYAGGRKSMGLLQPAIRGMAHQALKACAGSPTTGDFVRSLERMCPGPFMVPPLPAEGREPGEHRRRQRHENGITPWELAWPP